ncbi:MAG: efflux RND transporter periplasmic adaptor subunit [Geothermobacteraceae bacterium]
MGKTARRLIPVLILVLGVAGLLVMVKLRKAPERKNLPFTGVLVETVRVQPESVPVVIEATGTVQPRQRAEVVPQVSGKVVRLSPKLVTGGFVSKGEELFALEDIDYRLAVQRAEADVSRQRVEVATFEARAEVARREWQRLHPGEEPSPLTVYQPQLEGARAALKAAEAALEQARINLARTRVSAPFNAFVQNEHVDLGQYARAGTSVATLVGTDSVEIIVPLALDDLDWLDVPAQPGGRGSRAEVLLQLQKGERIWSGWIDRALAEIDAAGRMMRVAVVVEDPYGLKGGAGSSPLAVGSFVRVRLQGHALSNAWRLPARALRQGDIVWLRRDGRLHLQPVKVARRTDADVLVTAGLSAGDEVVLSQVAGAAEGLLLRTTEQEGDKVK